MNFNEFLNLAKTYKTIPVYKLVMADLLTPISVYMKLKQTANYSFIFESVEHGNQYGRFSFIGKDPRCIVRARDSKTEVFIDGKWRKEKMDCLNLLRKIQGEYNAPKLPGLPNFSGGLVGFLGYESIVWEENIPIYEKDLLQCPDAIFMLFHELIAFDHFKNQIILFSNVQINDDIDMKKAYEKALCKIDQLGEDLHIDINYQTDNIVKQPKSKLISDFNKMDFKKAVLKVKEHIKCGDIFQLVLSQRFHRKSDVESITLYRALRSINPSPYMFHLQLDDFDVVGASPELLVKVEDNQIEIRPIAGTSRRGVDKDEDLLLADKLLKDEKERAEHLMLVDLGRNDVGKAAQYNSVQVKDFMTVEFYSHVMHIVSDIRGVLREDKDVFDALYSGFPAGTLTGAPKIRAMEIINDLEPHRRGIYSGAIGYFDFSGDMNTCIAIRTMVVKDGTIFFQSGAGIVNDSDADKEYEETINKAKAINSAIDLAENGLIS